MSVSSVAVVGAGPRGLSIAEAVAQAEIPVTVVCVTGSRGMHARDRLERAIAEAVVTGRLTPGAAAAMRERLTVARDLGAVADADLVIESAAGDVRARRALLATLEGRLTRGSVLASNVAQSTLASMAEVLVRLDQFLGLRFAHPATHATLVELVPLPETAPGVVHACRAFCRRLGKTPVAQVERARATGR